MEILLSLEGHSSVEAFLAWNQRKISLACRFHTTSGFSAIRVRVCYELCSESLLALFI
jgi:hypothetical protein